MNREKAIVCWSSGKDSALALHRIRKKFEIVCLLTSTSEETSRVAMHGLRDELLDLQAKSLGFPLQKVPLPYPCPNTIYEERMRGAIGRWDASCMVFGDLFLEDIRRYREQWLGSVPITPVFPLWREDTTALADEIIHTGFKVILTCVDLKKLPAEFAGRLFNDEFIKEIPAGVDPCGENGEFHTFVFDGPNFSFPIPFQVGNRYSKDGFAYIDLQR